MWKMAETKDVAPPTYDEFVIARKHAEFDSEQGEDAYQVCRWYRHQMMLQSRAERWLRAHRAQA
jgi:hypothetical protein